MNLLAYTKKLAEQIAYYDALTKQDRVNPYFTNPFTQPVNITIIWVDEKDE